MLNLNLYNKPVVMQVLFILLLKGRIKVKIKNGLYGPFKNISHFETWAKTGAPGEKPPALSVQNLVSHMNPKRGSNQSDERASV